MFGHVVRTTVTSDAEESGRAGRVWDAVLDDRDRAVYNAAGYGRQGGWGERPALLVVDVNYNFVGDRPEPILDSIRRFPYSCGEAGWAALPAIAELLAGAREAVIPIFYTTQDPKLTDLSVGSWNDKNARALETDPDRARFGVQIVEEIGPIGEEVVIVKGKPSAFFATPLVSFLNRLRVDTVLVAGTTTSGCVRATVVDAFSYNYSVMVVEECVFDRGETSHKINLFDMESKYADVVPLTAALAYLSGYKGASRPSRG